MSFREVRSFESRVRVLSKTFTEADLTAAATSQTLDVLSGVDIGPGIYIVGVEIDLPTAFSGGGASAVSVDIGVANDVDAVVDGANLFAAVAGKAATQPPGITPHRLLAQGEAVRATFIADVNVANLTAGSCTIRVLYSMACPYRDRV